MKCVVLIVKIINTIILEYDRIEESFYAEFETQNSSFWIIK